MSGVDTKPYVVPSTVNAQVNFANIKKYVVGQGKDIGIPTIEPQRYPNNTYMLRLAEMYLIYAEAVLGNSASTSDAQALEYFNTIRQGLDYHDMLILQQAHPFLLLWT